MNPAEFMEDKEEVEEKKAFCVRAGAFIYSFIFRADSVSHFDVFRPSRAFLFIPPLPNLPPALSVLPSHPLIAEGVLAITAAVLCAPLCLCI